MGELRAATYLILISSCHCRVAHINVQEGPNYDINLPSFDWYQIFFVVYYIGKNVEVQTNNCISINLYLPLVRITGSNSA